MANILGNLVNRTISMAHKYLNGEVMAPSVYEDIDKELIDCVLSTKSKVDKDMDDLRIANALDDIFDIFRRSNKYIDETMPWVLARDESKKGAFTNCFV